MNAADDAADLPFTVFDVETTGTNVETDRIVSAYVGIINPDGQIAYEQEWLVNSGVPIPPEATAVHGITDAMVVDQGRPAPRAIQEIASTLASVRQSPLVVMNAPFDLTILNREIIRHRVGIVDPESGPEGLWWEPRPVIDPMVLDKALDEFRKGRRTLTALCGVYGVELADAHTASADAVAAGQLARILLRETLAKAGDDGTVTLDDVHRWQTRWKDRQMDKLRAYFQGVGNLAAAASVRNDWPIYPEEKNS